MPPIRKEHLLPEESFIHYCRYDTLSTPKLSDHINSLFLRAAAKDSLIVPLFSEKVFQTKDGAEESVDVYYYSPFQIYLVAGLIKNDIDENGYLRDPENKEWQIKQGTRYINWGGWGAFNADIYQKKRGEEPDQLANHFTLADEFHATLKLVHGLEEESRYKIPNDKQRYMTRQPTLAYNLDPIRDGGEQYLKQYGLDQKKLRRVIVDVGNLASNIDPLERWFYYVRRHPQFRRDMLKGMAAISQDLYGFCEIAYNLMEIAFKEKLPPLLDLLHPEIKPFLMDSAEYASGEDIKSIELALSNLKKWISDNISLIKDLAPTIQHEKVEEAISKLDERIADYERRYGDRRYVGSTRRYEPSILKMEDLDKQTAFWAQNMLEQRIAGKALTPREREQMLAHEISFAISSTLDDLGRDVADIPYRIAEATWQITHKAERDKEMSRYPALEAFGKEVLKTDPEYAKKHSEFWSKGIKEFEKPHQDRLDLLDRARKELHRIGGQTRLVLCAACRKNPVQRHFAHLDRQITHEAVCDDCFDVETKKVMSGTTEEMKKLKYAEWMCDHCDKKVLLKFAIGNTIGVTTLNKVPIQVSLKYGHMELRAKCPDCGKTSQRPVDWGWIS